MGLDMYLSGRKFLMHNRSLDEEGYQIEEIVVALGYWRKHPNLHGYIVNTFGPKDEAGGPVDDCEPIELDLEQLENIINAVKERRLPQTQGFFFGQSATDEQEIKQEIEDDLTQLGQAVAFLTKLKADNKMEEIRSVIYRASW